MAASVRSPISIVRDPLDGLADRAAVGWAIERLRTTIEATGVPVELLNTASETAGPTITVAGSGHPAARRALERAGVSVPQVPEALALVPDRSTGDGSVIACGADERGLVYAVLELVDRVEHGDDGLEALRVPEPVVQRPANAVRSVARCFASEVDDKPWFHDEGSWRRYLSMVVAQRFNRVNFMVGLGYNFPWHVTDAYLFFAYPFLLDVPGHRVRVPQLPEEERERNLEMLRFASQEAAARGMDFQLGLWTHAYEWIDSPDARHTIEGLTPQSHAAYCRDALGALLEACPAITGVTLRTHGESGVPERSWGFWGAVLDGVAGAGRRVGVDLHAKGLDDRTLEIALATGLPVTVSPKYAAEHMGLPYHQAAIRELDRPPTERDDRAGKASYMTVSEGSRRFTRYSYGDFLREDRPYDVVFRIWPGTQRLLLWGDPAMAAGFGRLAGLAGSQGFEWAEPLSLKGREGTGVPPRDGYRDASLSTADDWEKHAYTYRLLGRLSYDPDSDPETWRRSLRATFGSAAPSAERALASASRILPLVTSAHHPSASNNYYWPEIYTDIGIVGSDGVVDTHYYDTPIPKRFGTVCPLDPEIFSGVEEAVTELLQGRPSGRHPPWEVAGWLEDLAGEASRHLARIDEGPPDATTPAVRRLVADVAIQAALGRFFAGKLRAATLYDLAMRTGGSSPIREALEEYRAARDAWVEAAERADGYVDDLTFGPQAWLRGTWSDRLPAIDRDVDAMAALAAMPKPGMGESDQEARRLLAEVANEPAAPSVSHTPPPSYRRGEPVDLALDIDAPAQSTVASVGLRYRPVDQSKVYREVEMAREGGRFVAEIPGKDSESPFPLQYLFVVRGPNGTARRYPGLGAELADQPYYVIRPETEA